MTVRGEVGIVPFSKKEVAEVIESLKKGWRQGGWSVPEDCEAPTYGITRFTKGHL